MSRRPDERPASLGERLALAAYSLLWFVATPFIALYLWRRSRRQPDYRRHWAERFLGRYDASPPSRSIWVHAVSVGETRAAAPLVHALRRRHPDLPLLVTHMTPTGRETSTLLFGDVVHRAYLAYDYPQAVRRFLAHWRPAVGVVMETEIWPNLLRAADEARVPMLLANGRLSERSLRSALRWTSLMRPAARRFDRILAQTDGDVARFATLVGEGRADRVDGPTGNLKFDVDVPDAQRILAATFEARIGARSVWLCASTREGEEGEILDAWATATRAMADAPLLVVVPRHPQRFEAVAALASDRGFALQRRSDDAAIDRATRAWLGDSMGELFAYYLAADVAYVGGSIIPLGGQNLIEPAAVGCPVLLGPHTFNFAEASDEAVRCGAAVRVDDAQALVAQALDLLMDPPRRARMSAAGLAFAAAHRGATARAVEAIDALLDGASRTDGRSRTRDLAS